MNVGVFGFGRVGLPGNAQPTNLGTSGRKFFRRGAIAISLDLGRANLQVATSASASASLCSAV